MRTLICVLVALSMTACAASRPLPPSCDGANKRPVNRALQTSSASYAASYNCVA